MTITQSDVPHQDRKRIVRGTLVCWDVGRDVDRPAGLLRRWYRDEDTGLGRMQGELACVRCPSRSRHEIKRNAHHA